MNKMHLKKRKKKSHNKIIIIIILIIISMIYIFNLINKKVTPHFIEYSEIKVKKLASNVITSTVSNEIANNIKIEDIFLISYDNNKNINSIDFKTDVVNKLLYDTSSLVEKNLNKLENKNEVFEIPSGIVLNNSIFYNILPKIPVKLEVLGNTVTKLSTKIDSYGINNALIKVNLDISVDIKILLPFTSKIQNYTISIPIIMKVIEGSVPNYYLNGYLDTITN